MSHKYAHRIVKCPVLLFSIVELKCMSTCNYLTVYLYAFRKQLTHGVLREVRVTQQRRSKHVQQSAPRIVDTPGLIHDEGTPCHVPPDVRFGASSVHGLPFVPSSCGEERLQDCIRVAGYAV